MDNTMIAMIIIKLIAVTIIWEISKQQLDDGQSEPDNKSHKEIILHKIKKTLEPLFHILVVLPLALLALTIVILIIAIPFIYLGPVGGTVIWTCIVLVVSRI